MTAPAGVKSRSVRPRTGGATEPVAFVCPFSGKPLEFRECGQLRHVMVISPHGWSSKLFPTIEQAREWASYLNGRPRYEQKRVTSRVIEPDDAADAVRGLVVPPSDVADESLPPSLQSSGG